MEPPDLDVWDRLAAGFSSFFFIMFASYVGEGGGELHLALFLLHVHLRRRPGSMVVNGTLLLRQPTLDISKCRNLL
jgi:hypothetical protein